MKPVRHVGENAGVSEANERVGQVNRARVGLLALTAVVALALDVISKIIVVETLEGDEPKKLLGGALYLSAHRNSGAAFSMATGMTWILTLIAIGVVVVIIRLARKLQSVGWAIGLGLVLGGALGNLSDRLFREPGPLEGHVVDFLSVFSDDGSVWPIFNLADSAIVCGAVLLVILTLLGREYDGTVAARRARA